MMNKKNGEIELLRFVFTVAVMLFHSSYIVDNMPFQRGNLGVEFFFIVSGFLMMRHIEKAEQKNQNALPLGKESCQYIFNKARAIFPEIIIGAAITFIFILFTSNQGIKYILANSVNWFFDDVLLLRATGVGSSINGQLWYISSMLLAMALLYPLTRKYKDIMTNLVIPLGPVLLIGYLYKAYGSILKPTEMGILTMRGNIRALAELGLGMTGYRICEHIKKINFNAFGKVCFSIFKWALYGIIFVVIFFDIYIIDSVIPLIIAAAVILSFSGISIESGIFNNKLSYFLGKLSLPLYVAHYCFVGPEKYSNLKNVLPDGLGNGKTLAIFIACSFVNALLIMTLAGLYRKNREKLIRICQKIFISSKAE